MSLQGKRILFVGAGKMGGAMLAGLRHANDVPADHLFVLEPDAARADALVGEHGVRRLAGPSEAGQADVLVMAVKPQHLADVLRQLRPYVQKAWLVVSIVAGAKIALLAEGLDVPYVVRAMPNLPAQIGRGVTAWTAAPAVQLEGRVAAQTLLSALGEVVAVADERAIDMATALSGSGPAYVFLFAEALIDAGVHMGLSRADATTLALATLQGSAEVLRASGQHPAQLRADVTSPGGTTAEALYHMERAGLRAAIQRGVLAAFERAQALGRRADKDNNVR